MTAPNAITRREQWLDLAVYTEERDGWTASYRSDVDRRLSKQQGGGERVRLADGSVVTAVRGPERLDPWCDADGEALDVAAVELAP